MKYFNIESYVEYSIVFVKCLNIIGRYNEINKDIAVKGNNLSKNKVSIGLNMKVNKTNKFNVYTNYDVNKESCKHKNHMLTFRFNYEF